jgi:hypothetical protein
MPLLIAAFAVPSLAGQDSRPAAAKMKVEKLQAMAAIAAAQMPEKAVRVPAKDATVANVVGVVDGAEGPYSLDDGTEFSVLYVYTTKPIAQDFVVFCFYNLLGPCLNTIDGRRVKVDLLMASDDDVESDTFGFVALGLTKLTGGR